MCVLSSSHRDHGRPEHHAQVFHLNLLGGKKSHKDCCGLYCVPLIHMLKPQPLNMTIFGERVCKKGIKVKWGHKGGAKVRWDQGPFKKSRYQRSLFLPICRDREKAAWGSQERAIHEPGWEPSREAHTPGTLILDFWPPELCKKIISAVEVTQSAGFCDGRMDWLMQWYWKWFSSDKVKRSSFYHVELH